MMAELGSDSINNAGKTLAKADIEDLIKRRYPRVFELGTVYKKREPSSYLDLKKRRKKRMDMEDSQIHKDQKADKICHEKSNVILKNSILFLQHVVLYRDSCDCIQ